MPDLVDKLYDNLKEDGWVENSRENFRNYFLAPGKQGYQNRKALYDNMKEDGYVDSPTYEDFAQRMGLVAGKPERVDEPTYQPTPEEMAGFQGTINSAGRVASNPTQSYDRKADLIKKRQGLNVPQQINLGESNNLTPTEQRFNPETGKMEQGYMTGAGNEYDNKGIADMEQRQIDQAQRDEKYMQSLPGQLDDAYAERDRLNEELAKYKGQWVDQDGRVHYGNRGSDESVASLEAALRQNQQRITALEAERDDDGGTQFWRGFVDAAKNPSVQSFGLTDFDDMLQLMRIKSKIDDAKKTGQQPQLSAAEQQLMENSYLNNYAQSSYGDNRGFMYRAGGISMQALPFVAEFMATGGFGALTQKGAELGTRAAEKLALEGLKKTVVKNLGVLAGDVAAGWAMANTTGLFRTTGDIMQRHIGQVAVDDNGNFGFEGGKSIGRSIYEGQVANTLEYYTEKLGEHLQLGKWLAKGADKMGLSKLSKAVNYLSGSKWLERGGIQDYPSEVVEEQANLVLNAMLVGDNNFSLDPNSKKWNESVFNPKTQADIWGGMMLSIGLMQTPRLAATGYNAAGYYAFKKNVDVSDTNAAIVFGRDNWNMIKEQIDNCDNEQLPALLESVVKGKMSDEQKTATMNYAGNLLKMRGYNMGMMADTKEEENEAPQEAAVSRNLNQSYMAGHQSQMPDEMKMYVDEADEARENLLQYGQEFANMITDSENPVARLSYMLKNRDIWSDEEIAAAADYFQKQARAEGVMDGALDKVDLQVEQANAEVRGNTHQQTGSVIMAKGADDMDYYIIGGDVVTDPDTGMTSLAGTGGAVVVKDPVTGEVSVKSPQEVIPYSMQDANELIQLNETVLRQQLMQQAEDDINYGSPANEVYDLEDTVTLQDGNGGTIEGQIVSLPNSVDGVFVVQTNDGRALQTTADDLNKRVVGHNGMEVQRATPQQPAAQEPTEQPEQQQSGILDNATGEESMVEGTPSNQPQSALSRIPIRMDDKGQPVKNKKGRPILDWHKASTEDAAAALIETTGGNMVMARDTASDLVRQAQERKEKISKQKPKGDDPIEIAESRLEIQRQIDEQQTIIKQWQDVGTTIRKQMEAESAARQAEIEAAKSEEQRQREAEEARIRKEKQDETDRQRIREQIERDKEKRNKEYEPITKAREELSGDEEALAILNDAEPRDLEEWVSSLLRPHSMLWQDTSESERGLQSELGLKRADMQRMMTLLGTKESGAKPFGQVVLDIHEGLPEGMKEQYTDEDVRNTLLNLFNEGSSTRMMHLTEEHRIEEARQMAKENERRDREAEMDAWAEFYHLTPEEREQFEAYLEMPPTDIEEEVINQIIAENDENRTSDLVDQKPVSGTDAGAVEGGESFVQQQRAEADNNSNGNVNRQQGAAGGTETTGNQPSVADNLVAGETSGEGVDFARRKPEVSPEETPTLPGGNSQEENNTLKEAIIAARNGDVEAQEKLNSYGIKWEKKPVVRFVAQGEVDSILNGGRYEGRFGNGRVDVTNSTNVTTAATADYRITFKDELDWSLNDRLRMKNEELGDGYIMDGYSLEDVAIIEKRNPDGTYSVIYDSSKPQQPTSNNDEQQFVNDLSKLIDDYDTGDNGYMTDKDLIEEARNLVDDLPSDSDIAKRLNDAFAEYDDTQDAYYNENGQRDDDGSETMIEALRSIAAAKPESQPIGKTSSPEQIAEEEAKVDTNPSEAQKEAGNYQKGHISVDGYDITIENPKGSIRRGVDSKGNEWEQEMHNTYGYIRGTEGVDGDHIDVFLSENPTSGEVFVVDQVNPETGEFDEHKVMYGFADAAEATQAYLSNYEDGWKGLGAISGVSREAFKEWVESSHRKTKPFRDYALAKREQAKQEKPAAKAKKEPKQHKRIVSDDQMEELRKKLLDKFNNLNAGIDVERMLLGAMYAVGKIERGVTKFTDYAQQMVDEIGDAIRPYLKAFYNAVRDMPEAAEYRDQMDSPEDVEAFDVYNFDKQAKVPDAVTKAEQVVKQQKAKKAVKKIEKEVTQKIQQGDLFAGDLFGEPVESSSTTVAEPVEKADKPIAKIGDTFRSFLNALPDGELVEITGIEETEGNRYYNYKGKESNNEKKISEKDLKAAVKTREWKRQTESAKPNLDRNDYKTYMTPEAVAYFANKYPKYAHKDLAFIEGAVRDKVVIPVEELAKIPGIVEAENRRKAIEAQAPLQLSDKEIDLHVWHLLDAQHGSAVFDGDKIREVDGHEDFSGIVRQERKAFVIIGRPAGGKSSVFANPLSNQYGARIIDSDVVKEWLDGFDGGFGAGYVQDMSSKIAEKALDIAVNSGDNVVLPRIGGSSVMILSAALRMAGYDVQLYYNDVVPDTSYMRSQSRFSKTGRFLSLDYLTTIGDKPSENFRNFAEKTLGDYIDECTEEEVQKLRGRVERLVRSQQSDLLRTLYGWLEQRRRAKGDGSVSGNVERPESDGATGPVDANSPIFSYAEWKSNDVSFGEKPKEIWNSKSGKPMPGKKEETNNEAEQKVSGKPESAGEGTGQASGTAERTGTERSPESDRTERSGSGYSVENTSREVNGAKQTRSGSINPAERENGNARNAVSPTSNKNRRNNVGERGKDYAPLSPKARFNANIEAIKMMRALMEDGVEAPTKDQMEVLRQYSGWGGLGTFFNDEDSAENKTLRDVLTEEEYNDAVMSINSAYYTPAMVIDSMWDIAKEMGFNGGTLLEGSAGIGNIIGQMPKDMSRRSDIEAVEIDTISGNILKLLYPDAKVHIQGFQDTVIPNGSVDLAITNVPFVTGLHVFDKTDKDLSRRFTNIHDFCIAKNIRKLREGGIGIFISSSGTLDKSTDLRQWITDEGQADVVGAFRLNNETFGGTTATSDIIVVRKRTNGQKSDVAIDVNKATPMRVGTYEDKYGDDHQVSMVVNDYYKDHPEMMAGEMAFGYEKGDTFRPGSYGLYPVDGMSQDKMLNDFVKSMSKAKETPSEPKSREQKPEPNQLTAVKEGRMLIDDSGRICVSRFGTAVPLDLNDKKVKGQTKQQCFKDYQAVQKAVDDVLQQQLGSPDDATLKPKLDALNKAYDTFVKRYGTLHKNTAISFLRNDIDFPSFLALENYSESKDINGKVTVITKKAPLFTQRVLGFKTEPKPKTIKDALTASIFRTNGIDLPWITQKLNEVAAPPNGDNWTTEDVKKGILVSRLGFENPATGQLEVRHQYLSGNVREKLAQAEAYNTDGQYNANVEELQKVVPMDIPSHLIDFTLGSSWIPNELYTDYLKTNYGLPDNVKLTHVQGRWVLDVDNWRASNETNKAKGVYSQKFRTNILGSDLVESALNNRPYKVAKQESFGYGDSKTTRTVVDQEATQACNARIDEIKDEFKQYIRKRLQDDEELGRRVEKIYNDKFNALVPLRIDEEMLPDKFEDANMNISLYDHQKRGVMRGVTSPTMLAHEVGTGKSFTLISTAMEMRRLGTAKKPMIVVQNATVAQMTSDAKLLYPNAKILSLSEQDRDAEGRRAFYAKIRYNDWDMIIIPQSTLDRIPDSPERELQFIQEQIDEKKHIIEQARAAKMDKREIDKLIRDLEKKEQEYGDKFLDSDPNNGLVYNAKYGGYVEKSEKKRKKDAKREAASLDKAETKAQEKLDRATDDVQFFDDLGVDAILVDEAHGYKHLGFETTLGRSVKGVDPSYSKKCAGLYNKTRAVFEKAGWKNVVFATGTPISNTAAEIWAFMKYLMPADVMKDNDIYYFDDFVHNFGSINQMLEFKTNGKFNEVTRFAAYVNRPELMRIWMQVADIVRTEEVGEVKSKVPEKEGGKDQDVFLPQSPSLVSIMAAVRAELERFENMDGKEKRENSSIPLTMYGIAKRAAIDPRLVNPDAPDEPMSKTNAAVKEIVKDLNSTKKYNGTVAVFCDNQNRLGPNGIVEFNIFDDMKAKLVAQGVPEEQIAIIKSSMSISAKQKIFDKVNTGEVRVILGSTQTLGTGVNIQERLHLLIHMDAPDRPMDYTQRNGRIERQGNLHREWGLPIRILRFGVEDSLDVTAYQRLKTKSGFIDSIMKGKEALANNQTDRTIEEEEEGLFDNPVAVLSGSQFAMKKNQAERELRKLQGKYNAWEADQIYVASKLRSNESWIKSRRDTIAENEKELEHMRSLFPDGKVKEITVDGVKVDMTAPDADKNLYAVLKEKINDPVNATVKKLRENEIYNDETQNYSVYLDGHAVNFKFDVTRTNEWDSNVSKMRTVIHKNSSYSSPDLRLNSFVSSKSAKEYLDDIMERYVSGKEYEENIQYAKQSIDRTNAEQAQLKEREGQPFQFDKELAEAKKRVAEYTELMKKELEEKEAKYAQQRKEAEESNNFDLKKAEEIDDEDVLYSSDEDWEENSPIYSNAFKDYFGDWESDPDNASKVVDDNGKPLIVYHGTNLTRRNNSEPFYTFNKDSHFGTQGQARHRTSMYQSKTYMDFNMKYGLPLNLELTKIYPVYLNIRNPKRVSDVPMDEDEWDGTQAEWWEKQIARAKEQGYDGLVYLNEYEDPEHPADSWIAFYPEQVKSAEENIGGYDSNDPDIRHRYQEHFAEGKTFPIRTNVMESSYNVIGASRTYSTELMPDEYGSEQQLLDALRVQYPEYFVSIEDGSVKMESWNKAFADSDNAQTAKQSKGARNYIERKTRNAIAAVEQLANRMNLNVEVLTSTEGLTGKKARSKGWFNPKTGKITLVLPNNANLSDLINTLLHEGVAHYGLRHLFGRNFDTFLDNVYNNVSPEIRARIDAAIKRNGWSRHEATEEYLARLAERTDFEHAMNSGWWTKIKNFFMKMLAQAGFNITLSDNDLRYVLWRSYDNLLHPDSRRTIFDTAKEIQMQSSLGVGRHARERERLQRTGRTDTTRIAAEKSVSLYKEADHLIDSVMNSGAKMNKEEQAIGQMVQSLPESQLQYAYKRVNDMMLDDEGLDIDEHSEKIKQDWIKENGVKGIGQVMSDDLKALMNKYGEGMLTLRWELQDRLNDLGMRYSLRTKEPPKKTGKGYKVFVLKDGQLYPPMVANPNGEGTPVGVWLDADAAPIAGESKTGRPQVKAGGKGTKGGSGQLAYRPGWHLGTIPYALQFNRKDANGERTLFPNNFVWAEVEYADDVDYQQEAHDEGINANGKYQHSLAGLKHVPTDGSYKYRTNPDPRTDEWVITGAMRVNRILSRQEVDDMVRKAGREPQQVQNGDILTQDIVDKLNAEIQATKEADEMGLLYRDDNAWEDDIAQQMYEEAVAKDSLKWQEAWQDSMAGLKAIQDAIAAETGRKATGAEDAYRFENRMHGKAKNMTEQYDWRFYRPMLKAFSDFINKMKLTQEDGLEYLISKSGLERNIYYAMRDGLKAKVADETNRKREELEKKYARGTITEADYLVEKANLANNEAKAVDDSMQQIRETFAYQHAKDEYNAGNISYTEYLRIIEAVIRDNMKRKTPKKDSSGHVVSDNYYDDFATDYSGLTETLAKDMYDAAQKVKKQAQREIDPKQRKALWAEYDKQMRQAYAVARQVAEDEVYYVEGTTAETQKPAQQLWDKINAATKETLKTSYESGLIDRNGYNKVRAMFDYYIPLRGWDEDKASDVYTYMGRDNVFSPAVKKTWGRKSKAENPLAYIGNIAVSTILSGHRNQMKQHFLNYVMNNPTSLVSISESWYENIAPEGEAPVWILRTADTAGKSPDEISQIVNDFNEEMQQKQREGKAMPVKGRLRLDVNATKGQKAEHVVEVQRAGHNYQLYINGNPKAAQALNGTLTKAVSRISDTYLGKQLTNLNRSMAMFFTSKNPAFVVSNLSRDLNMAGASVAVNEGAKYNKKFIANVAKVLTPRVATGDVGKMGIKGLVGKGRGVTGMMPKLMSKWKDGKLDENNETERYFKEFMDEGGETGFVNMLSVDSFKDKMKKEISQMNGSSIFGGKVKETTTGKALRLLGENFEFYNRCAEDATRFIVYMTSRQMGKSLEDSIADAKDVTLNFNRKGTGDKGNAEIRDLFIFVNPAIQALANLYRMAKNHPLKFGAVTTGFVTFGALMPVINQWLINLFGDDDDKDSYWNLPPWVRKNNLVFWIPGTKDFVTIPLAQEFRVFYGIGEMISSASLDHPNSNMGLEVFSSVADLIPINPTGNGGNLMVDFAPTGVQPLMQVGENVDFTGKPIWKENQGNEHAPMYTKAYISTPAWMTKVSEAINDATGGNEGKKGYIEQNAPVWGNYINNPAVWNHLLQGYFGGMYNTIAKAFDVGVTAAQGEVPKVYQTPVINRFLNRPVERDNAGVLGEEYYNLTKERDALMYELRTWKKKAAEGDENAQAHVDEITSSDDYKRAEVISHYEKIMKDLKAGEKSATESADKADIKRSISLYKQQMMEELAALDEGKDPLEAAMEQYNKADKFSEKNKLRMRIEKLIMRQAGVDGKKVKTRSEEVDKALSYLRDEETESRNTTEQYLGNATAEDIVADARIRAAKAKIKTVTDKYKKLLADGKQAEAAKYRQDNNSYFVAESIINNQNRVINSNKKLLGKGSDKAIMKMISNSRNMMLRAIDKLE